MKIEIDKKFIKDKLPHELRNDIADLRADNSKKYVTV